MDQSTAATGPTVPEPPDYQNPLESSSRWYLSARAQAVRSAANVGFSLFNRLYPPAPVPTKVIWLDSTLSAYPGKQKIKADVWVPTKTSDTPRTAVINMHGGGWILGQGTDDSRWAGAIMEASDAVVFSINYRLAPSHPFPVPVEDCVDAILQITQRSKELGINPNRIVLSGFSAGATNALASWVIMQDPTRWKYELPSVPPNIIGLCLFYPVLDWTITRQEKRQSCNRPEMTLPKGLTDLIDASYVHPPIPRESRTDPRLSPGLMPDVLLQKLPPIHLCLCEYDMLLAEGLRFSNRVELHKMHITTRIVNGEKHAWDNPLPMTPKESVHVEYGEATQSIASWLGQPYDKDTESTRSMRRKRLRMRRPASLIFRSMTTS